MSERRRKFWGWGWEDEGPTAEHQQGIAAALSLSSKTALAELDVPRLQRALVKAGAWLPPGTADR